MQEAQKAQSDTPVTVAPKGHPLISMARWLKGRNPEARAILHQGGRTTFLTQLGGKCGAVLLDKTGQKTVFRGGHLVSKGEQAIRDFRIYSGTLDVVLMQFMEKGWVPAKTQGLLELTVLPKPTDASREVA